MTTNVSQEAAGSIFEVGRIQCIRS